MYLRGNQLGLSTPRHEDYHLATAVGFVVAAYLGFFVVLYWLMQPTVTANPGLAAYQPPPKTIVRYADSPWVPPPPSEALPPIRAAAEPAPAIARAASPLSRRKRPRSKRRGQALAGRNPFESNPIRSGGAGLRPGRRVLAPGSNPRFPRVVEGRQRPLTSALR